MKGIMLYFIQKTGYVWCLYDIASWSGDWDCGLRTFSTNTISSAQQTSKCRDNVATTKPFGLRLPGG